MIQIFPNLLILRKTNLKLYAMIRYNILSIFCLLIAFTACVSENISGPNDPENRKVMTLNLEVPALQILTKAGTVSDAGIKDLKVYVFNEDNEYLYVESVNNIKITSGNEGLDMLTGSVNLASTNKEYTLIFLANTDGLNGIEFTKGTTTSDFLNSLVFVCPEADNQGGEQKIPMYGEVKTTLYPEDDIHGTLLRSMASIEVSLTRDVDNFDIRQVSLYGINDKGLVAGSMVDLNIPSNASAKLDALVWENPQPWEEGSYESSGARYNKARFYVPETRVKEDIASNLATNVFVIIKGYYYGHTINEKGDCYYRLDFITKASEAMDVKRNHCYKYEIAGIHEFGEINEQNAINHKADNREGEKVNGPISIDVDGYDDMNDSVTDGLNTLIVSNSVLQLVEGSALPQAKLKILSKGYLNWELIELPDYITTNISSGSPGVVAEVWLTVDLDRAPSEEIKFYVKAGTLWRTIRILRP